MAGMTIDESAERIGALVWTERRLFELLGGWVPTIPEPEAKVALARLSRHHGEHALALAPLLPETRDHRAEALVRPAGDAPAADAPFGGQATTERLAAAVDALTVQLQALEAYLADASPVRDGPGIRVITAVLAEDWSASEELHALADR